MMVAESMDIRRCDLKPRLTSDRLLLHLPHIRHRLYIAALDALTSSIADIVMTCATTKRYLQSLLLRVSVKVVCCLQAGLIQTLGYCCAAS
jgi:hypothetical protein